MIYILLSLSYALGSIPFGLVFAKLFQTEDLRLIGSGNIGATNAFRTGNKMVGMLTFLFDTLKGSGAYFLVASLGYSPFMAFLAGALSIVGHMFPVWLKFKGGKGIATTFGVVLAAEPLIGLASLALWGGIVKILKMSSAAGLLSMVFICTSFFLKGQVQEAWLLLVIFALVLYRHKENIMRILNKTELEFKK